MVFLFVFRKWNFLFFVSSSNNAFQSHKVIRCQLVQTFNTLARFNDLWGDAFALKVRTRKDKRAGTGVFRTLVGGLPGTVTNSSKRVGANVDAALLPGVSKVSAAVGRSNVDQHHNSWVTLAFCCCGSLLFLQRYTHFSVQLIGRCNHLKDGELVFGWSHNKSSYGGFNGVFLFVFYCVCTSGIHFMLGIYLSHKNRVILILIWKDCDIMTQWHFRFVWKE